VFLQVSELPEYLCHAKSSPSDHPAVKGLPGKNRVYNRKRYFDESPRMPQTFFFALYFVAKLVEIKMQFIFSHLPKSVRLWSFLLFKNIVLNTHGRFFMLLRSTTAK
jgi:hypothetical protein